MLLGLLTSVRVTENKNYYLSVVNYIFNSLKSKPENVFN